MNSKRAEQFENFTYLNYTSETLSSLKIYFESHFRAVSQIKEFRILVYVFKLRLLSYFGILITLVR